MVAEPGEKPMAPLETEEVVEDEEDDEVLPAIEMIAKKKKFAEF